MKSPMWMLVLGLFLAAASGCATGPVITADYDRSANFTAYRTFGFASPLGTDTAGYESLVTQTMKAASRREMERRGYMFVETDPDLLVNFNAHLSRQLQVTQAPPKPSMYYGYRGGYYGGWTGYSNQTRIDQYVERRLGDPHYEDPAMKAHLSGCGACADEADSLRELLSHDAG